MDVREDRDGDIVVLELRGRFDGTTAASIGERLTAVLAAPGARLVLDFDQLEYISSAGFRVLLLAAKRAKAADSRIVLCGLTGRVRQVFVLGGFLDLLPLYASREESLASLR